MTTPVTLMIVSSQPPLVTINYLCHCYKLDPHCYRRRRPQRFFQVDRRPATQPIREINLENKGWDKRQGIGCGINQEK